MNESRVRWLAIAIALLATAAGYWLGLQRAGIPAPATGTSTDPAHLFATADGPPDVQIKDLEGREHSLTEWTGKVLVVNFWATWCPPCVKEIPAFVQLQAELEARGLQFVGIALDDPQAAADFVRAHRVNYPVLAGADDVSTLMQGLGNAIGALPYTVVFDRGGRVVHTHQGEWSRDGALTVLEPLLDPISDRRQVAR
jgi:thiol-disulfide isomerase/thioredoxin